jgi:hypothetical protein
MNACGYEHNPKLRNLSHTAQTDLETCFRNLKIDPLSVTCNPSIRSYDTVLKGISKVGIS